MPAYKNKDTKKIVLHLVPKRKDGKNDKRYISGSKLFLKKDGTVDLRYNHCIKPKDRSNLKKVGSKKTKSNWGYPKNKDGRRDMRYTEKCWLKTDGTPDYRRF